MTVGTDGNLKRDWYIEVLYRSYCCHKKIGVYWQEMDNMTYISHKLSTVLFGSAMSAHAWNERDYITGCKLLWRVKSDDMCPVVAIKQSGKKTLGSDFISYTVKRALACVCFVPDKSMPSHSLKLDSNVTVVHHVKFSVTTPRLLTYKIVPLMWTSTDLKCEPICGNSHPIWST